MAESFKSNDSSSTTITATSIDSQPSPTNNNDDDTKLHDARYHKTESDWDELLAQVCIFSNEKNIAVLLPFTIDIVRVPSSLKTNTREEKRKQNHHTRCLSNLSI